MAGEPISLASFGEYLATQLGISDFAGGILASMIFTMLVLVPVLFLTKGKNTLLITILAVGCFSFGVAIAWLPVWTLAVICLIVALMAGAKFKDLF